MNIELPIVATIQGKIHRAGENKFRDVGKDTGLCLTRGLHWLHRTVPVGVKGRELQIPRCD